MLAVVHGAAVGDLTRTMSAAKVTGAEADEVAGKTRRQCPKLSK